MAPGSASTDSAASHRSSPSSAGPSETLRLPHEPTRAVLKIDVLDPGRELGAHVGWPLEGPGHPDPRPARQDICPQQTKWRAIEGCQRQRRNICKLHVEAAGNADDAGDADHIVDDGQGQERDPDVAKMRGLVERDGPRSSIDRVCPGSVHLEIACAAVHALSLPDRALICKIAVRQYSGIVRYLADGSPWGVIRRSLLRLVRLQESG